MPLREGQRNRTRFRNLHDNRTRQSSLNGTSLSRISLVPYDSRQNAVSPHTANYKIPTQPTMTFVKKPPPLFGRNSAKFRRDNAIRARQTGPGTSSWSSCALAGSATVDRGAALLTSPASPTYKARNEVHEKAENHRQRTAHADWGWPARAPRVESAKWRGRRLKGNADYVCRRGWLWCYWMGFLWKV